MRVWRRLQHTSLPPLPAWAVRTSDVSSSGLCADGRVLIREASRRKGLGAFALEALKKGLELDVYQGEVITLGEMVTRYGGDGDSDLAFAYEAANKQAAWVEERRARGVGVTGQYLFHAGKCPRSKRTLLIDGEDPMHANWTRYINHSTKRPNLATESEMKPGEADGQTCIPRVRFIVLHDISPGTELTFDYGDGFEISSLVEFEDD